MEHSSSDSDVAVIGMACRVAGADSPSALWDLLASSRDVQSEITRFNAKGYYHPEGGPRKGLTNVKNAYMLDDDAIGRFDHAFFQTTPIEAIAMDPQHRMLLEIAYETVENAGILLEDFVGTDTAVYAGMDSGDYHSIQTRDIDDTPKYLATGTPACFAANRLSYFFNLSGASLSIDSACSSTMAALHQAVRTVQNRESRAALVCGAKLILTPDMFMPSSELGFLSPSGRCRSFDAAGDGYGRGEGVLAILLKPLKEALANRDPIRAVIKGTRLNQDGRTQGITLPSSEAQRLNMESLYRDLGVSPNDIQYVEAHGTGTAAGDPLELSAINSVFRGSHKHEPLVLGSIKSNVGHLESCAGLAAVIKAILCIERGKIPPQMHFDKPNPKINFYNVRIPTALMDWPGSRHDLRRAAINTFGAGGTNGHAVIEQYQAEPFQDHVRKRPLLFKVSAMDTTALKRLSLSYADHVERNNPDLHDLAYTLLSRRSTMKRCSFFTASTLEEAVEMLRVEDSQAYTKGDENVQRSIMLFTGQGAQWAEMGEDLIHQSPIFKATLLECDSVLATLPNGPGWSIIKELSKTADVSNIYQAEFSQPLCTALQIGLVAVWRSWGFTPDAVVGHSSGEIAAAYTAGIISLRDAIITAYYRGFYLARIVSPSSASKQRGCMCAVGMSAEDANKLLDKFVDRIQLASINSETSCTLSGDKDAIEDVIETCAKTGTFCRKLHVDIAYHSHHMLGIASFYEDALTEARVSVPAAATTICDMFSSVTGQRLDPKNCSPAYWTKNLVSTVQYASALIACMNHHPEVSVILEIGPHPALKGPSQEILRSLGVDADPYFHSCVRGKDGLRTLLETAGAMIAHGVPLKTPNINAREVISGLDSAFELGNVLVDLPSYSWEHSQSFWTESKMSRRLRYRQFPRHQLLGSRYLEDIPSCPSWRSLIRLKEVPWLEEIRVPPLIENRFQKLPVQGQGSIAVPATVFVLMALEAARQLQFSTDPGALNIRLSDVLLRVSPHHALFINEDTTIELHLIARQTDVPNIYQFEILSTVGDDHDDSIEQCSGRLEWSSDSGKTPEFPLSKISHDCSLLDNSQALGQDVTVKLKGLQISSIGATGKFEASSHHHENYFIDPVALNSLLHLPPVSLLGISLPTMYRITGIDSITIPTRSQHPRSGRFAMTTTPTHSYGGQSSINIMSGTSLAHISGLRFEAHHLADQKPASRPLYFKPTMLPDITKIMASEPMALHSCIEMMTHKWPMCDIGLRDVTCNIARDIVKAVSGVTSEERPRFRSINIQGEPKDPMSDRLAFIGEFVPDARFHMLFEGMIVDEEQSLKKLLPHGLLCTRSPHMEEEIQLAAPFKKICRLTGFDEYSYWTLWCVDETSGVYSNHKAVVFACPEQSISSIQCLPSAEHIPLEPTSVEGFSQRGKNARYDAIVIDCTAKSIITTWLGAELIPWLQRLLVSADTILWVTQQASQSPFSNVAGALLRTLQAEKPSLKVTWLTFRENESDIVVQETISSVYDALLRGENEIKYELNSSRLDILRYQPDDSLCALTGHALPRTVSGRIFDQDYEVSLATGQEPILMSSYMDSFKPIESGKVRITVEASIIDMDDVMMAFNGRNNQSTPSRLGKFLAGQVESEGNSTFPAQSKVVGWHHGAHHNSLEILPERLQINFGDLPAAGAAASFGACAVALSVVDGFARARLGDSFKVNVGGIIKEAISCCCEDFGATLLGPETDQSADFNVSFGKSDGLLVNGRPVEVTKYLESKHGAETVAQAWKKRRRFTSPLYPFELSDIRQAFEIAQLEAYSTVLVHSNIEKVNSSVAVYKKGRTLFSSDGAYILVGGLGGLGRFVLSWMVSQGARRLVVISRNGLKSKEAQDTFAHINASDASLEVMKVDACDRKALADALAEVRQTCPIKAIINLAMVLGDAPLDQMTGWQWDRALRLKVDSSWILHEETLEDPLDFFILFSSIASVLGNRSQAGYNVGNAFLNALADYRKSLGLPAVSIALGAMTDIGILHELGREDLLQTLSRSGLSHLRREHLANIMEAAVTESNRSERSLIVTGLEMFQRVDGKLVGSQDQTQLYWTELPEFGFLQTHRLSNTRGAPDEQLSLQVRMQGLDEKSSHVVLLDAFLVFLSQLLGFPMSTFTPSVSLAMYGLDSLSAVSCQYWFHRVLSIDVSVLDVLNSLSINLLITKACTKVYPRLLNAKINGAIE